MRARVACAGVGFGSDNIIHQWEILGRVLRQLGDRRTGGELEVANGPVRAAGLKGTPVATKFGKDIPVGGGAVAHSARSKTPPPAAGYDCPGAQPDRPGARPFGVISGTADATRLFRFGAHCEESGCAHHDGRRCSLGARVRQGLPAVVDALPPCLIRTRCRWYAEQGGEVCRRGPQVVTMIPQADRPLNAVAAPR